MSIPKSLMDIEEGIMYVRLYNLKPYTVKIIKQFERRYLSQWDKVRGERWGEVRYEIGNQFGVFTPDEKEYRMAKSFLYKLEEYFTLLELVFPEIEVKTTPILEPKSVNFQWKDIELTPRNDEQIAYCNFILQEDKKLVVINAAPGSGKTVMTIIAFVKMGYRVLLTVLPRYVPIWIITFKKRLVLSDDDIIDVSEHDVNKLYQDFLNETINPKIIFFNLTQIGVYLKKMKEYPESIPHIEDFYSAMKPGVRIVDEAHESIHTVYTSLLYGNFHKTVALSATLKGDDDFINRIYSGLFPDTAYLKAPRYDKYIKSITYHHHLNLRKYKIKYEGFGGYQHSIYESSLLKNREALDGYYKMIRKAFYKFYLKKKLPEQKALFFFSTILMCEYIGKRLKSDFPNLDLIVFTGKISKLKGMEYEYQNHDIVVTTPSSCGTGKDIPKLYIVFSGVSVSSTQRIDQMTGRLRDISDWWPDLAPIYLTFVCRDIKKQMQYDTKKKQVIRRKTKKFITFDSGVRI